METKQTAALVTTVSTNKNQEAINPLLVGKEFLNPKLIAEYHNQGLVGHSGGIRLYIAASIVANAKDNKDYFEKAVNIARKLNVTPELVRQAIKRKNKIIRGGSNGQRGRRNWIIVGINDKKATNITKVAKE